MVRAKSAVFFREVLRNKAFVTLWVNQILLQISYNLLNVSLLILVFKLTNSNTITATFILMAMLPVFLFGMFSGVVADRFDKRKILLLTDLGIGLVMLVFIIVQQSAVLILATAFVLNSVFQFFVPTEAATLPAIVSRRDLFTANALFQFTPMASLILGATMAGPIVANFGYNPVFVFGAMACLATFFLRRALPSLPAGKAMVFKRKEGLLNLMILSRRHTMEGLSYIFSDKRVWISIGILTFMQASFSTVAVLAPGFMERVLGLHQLMLRWYF